MFPERVLDRFRAAGTRCYRRRGGDLRPQQSRLVGVSTQPEFTAASRIPAYSLPRPLEETTCSRGHLPFSCLNQARSQRPFLQWVRLGNRRPVGVPPASALGLRVPHQ